MGFGNFAILFAQPLFWQALVTSLYFTAVMVPVATLLSLGLALLLREGIQTRRGAVWRSMVFLPHVTPVVATSIIWIWLFDPQFGLLNAVLGFFHLPQPGWLASTQWAMPSVIIYSLWHSLGLYTVLFLGALATLPRSVLEAAQVDGAKRWYLFRRVILPLVSPVTFFVVVLSTINTLQSFSQIYALTGGPHGGAGGPAFATTTDSLLVYQTAFLYNNSRCGNRTTPDLCKIRRSIWSTGSIARTRRFTCLLSVQRPAPRPWRRWRPADVPSPTAMCPAPKSARIFDPWAKIIR